MPQRFIWSGLQTYYDIIQFIESCKQGQHPAIHREFSFNVFAYSIGGFLAQILKLTNYNRYFEDTKVCLFCSGTTFNRLSPVSKFILDSEANVALYSYLVEHFEKMLEKDRLLNHYIREDHEEGKVFFSMLDYKKMREFREGLLKKYESQICAITLKKDNVIPSFEVVNTLRGAWRDINIRVDEIDFDRDYLHENPFPADAGNSGQVDEDFRKTFDKVCGFLNQK
jgi:flagellar biosynthesis chaperone FliJ